MKKVHFPAGALSILVYTLSYRPAALLDLCPRALLSEVAAEAIPVDRDEGREHRRLGRKHHLVVDGTRHVAEKE